MGYFLGQHNPSNYFALTMVKHWKDTYNVSLLEYGDDYSCLESSLEELRDLVFELRAERGMP